MKTSSACREVKLFQEKKFLLKKYLHLIIFYAYICPMNQMKQNTNWWWLFFRPELT